MYYLSILCTTKHKIVDLWWQRVILYLQLALCSYSFVLGLPFNLCRHCHLHQLKFITVILNYFVNVGFTSRPVMPDKPDNPSNETED